jgi:hypothetical protein
MPELTLICYREEIGASTLENARDQEPLCETQIPTKERQPWYGMATWIPTIFWRLTAVLQGLGKNTLLHQHYNFCIVWHSQPLSPVSSSS